MMGRTYNKKKLEFLAKIREQNKLETFKERGYTVTRLTKDNNNPTRKFKTPNVNFDSFTFLNTPKNKLKKNKTQERQTSYGEKLVAEWLVKNNILFKREKEFSDLINPITGKALIVDFYLHAHKIVIEFDGRQHYKASKLFDRNGDSLEARMQRDSVKNAYCANKGFKMIRIKYTEINIIDKILATHFIL